MKRDKIKLISAMTILGTISIVRRNIPYASSVVSLVRGLIGCLFLLLLRLVQKKPMNLPNIRKNFFLLFVSGALLGINWIVLFEAYRYTTVAIATVCNYMAPVFVMAASPVLLHEKLTLKKCLCVAVALVGMLMASGVRTASVTDMKGIGFAMFSAVTYAGGILLNKKIKGLKGDERSIVQLGISTIVLLPYVLKTEDLQQMEITPTAIGLLLVIGVVYTGIAYALYYGSLETIPAQTVAILSYIDFVVAILVSAFIFHEETTAAAWVGVLAVLGAAIFSEVGFEPGERRNKGSM